MAKKSEKAIHLNVSVPVSHFQVDKDGNLVITNKQLAKKVKTYLDKGEKLTPMGALILCCGLNADEE